MNLTEKPRNTQWPCVSEPSQSCFLPIFPSLEASLVSLTIPKWKQSSPLWTLQTCQTCLLLVPEHTMPVRRGALQGMLFPEFLHHAHLSLTQAPTLSPREASLNPQSLEETSSWSELHHIGTYDLASILYDTVGVICFFMPMPLLSNYIMNIL